MRAPLRQMTVQENIFFLRTTINVNRSGTRLCGLTSKAAPASEKFRSTQQTERSPNLMRPVSRTLRRDALRASDVSMTDIKTADCDWYLANSPQNL
jgi:hypothetical protein